MKHEKIRRDGVFRINLAITFGYLSVIFGLLTVYWGSFLSVAVIVAGWITQNLGREALYEKGYENGYQDGFGDGKGWTKTQEEGETAK